MIILIMIMFRIIQQWMRFMHNSFQRRPPQPELLIRYCHCHCRFHDYILLFDNILIQFVDLSLLSARSEYSNHHHTRIKRFPFMQFSLWTLIYFCHTTINQYWFIDLSTKQFVNLWIISTFTFGFIDSSPSLLSAAQAAALPKGARVEIEAVAIVGNILDAK